MSDKKASKPAWYKNTYFWIGGILFILGLLGIVGGDAVIRDPGQKPEHNLWWLYMVGAVVMIANGWLSHSQTVQHYRESLEAEEEPAQSKDAAREHATQS